MKEKYKYIVIFVLAFLVYGNTLFHDYALDDAIVITQNEYTVQGLKGIKGIITEDSFSGFFEEKGKSLVAGGRYRPLSVITFAIEWELIMGTPFKGLDYDKIKDELDANANPNRILPSNKFLKDLSNTIHIDDRESRVKQQKTILNTFKIIKDNEQAKVLRNLKKMHSKRNILLFVSHFFNVLLFAFTCLILLLLLDKLLLKFNKTEWYLNLSFLTVLIFLVHPIHTEVVANIKGRDEILSLLGSLLATYFVFSFLEKKSFYKIGIVFLSFLLALFSKELAVTFIAVIPISLFFFADKSDWLKKTFAAYIPILLASAIYFYVRNQVVGGMQFEPSNELMNNSFVGMSFGQRYATVFHTLLVYLKLLIFPHPLTFDYYPYHIPVMEWNNILPIVSLAIYLFLGLYTVLKINKKSMIVFGFLFYIITLSPTSNILFSIGVFMNERFIYASSIGIILIIAFFITQKTPNYIIDKKYIMFFVLMILGLMSFKSIHRNRAWENDFTLFTTDVEISKNSAKSNTSAGGKLIEEAIKPENTLKKDEYLSQSIIYLKRAVKIHPKYIDAYLLLGNAQWELYQSLDSMYLYYESILKLNPSYEKVYTNIFQTNVNEVFKDKNKAESNISVLHSLEKYKSNNYFVNYHLGKIYGQYLGDLETSLSYLEKASLIDPNSKGVFKDLGVVYGMLNQFDKSILALEKAIELDKDDPVLRLNLVMSYINIRDYNLALKWMDSIFEMDIKKENVHILINLSHLYRNFNNNNKSIESLNKAKVLNPNLFSND